MAADKNKIAQTLSPQDLSEFIDECWHTQGGLTLSKIQGLAEKRGLKISLMAATSFRDTTFARHLASIKQARELGEQIKELKRTGGNVADSLGDLLSHKVMDLLTREEGSATGDDKDEPLDLKALSLVIARMRTGDARVRALELAAQREKRAQMDVARIAIEKAGEIKTITADATIESSAKLERVRQLLFGEFEEETPEAGE